MRLGYLRKDLLNRMLSKKYNEIKLVSFFFFKALNKDCYYFNSVFFSYLFFWFLKSNTVKGLNVCYFTLNKKSVLRLFKTSRHVLRFSLCDNYGLKRSLW